MQTALDVLDTEQRIDTYESMAAVLDDHPEYVDELYSVVRRHPATLERFLWNAARDLSDPALARTTSELLVQYPDSLANTMRVLLQTLSEKGDAAARAAVMQVMADERYILGELIRDHPDELVMVMNAALEQIATRPLARTGLRTSMHHSSDVLAPILVEHPETLAVLLSALVDAGFSGTELLEMVNALLAPD